MYFDMSSIHGFYHLTAPRRTALEYLLWLVVIAMGVTGAAEIGATTWGRYKNNPTVISVERNVQEWNTSFPSVTFCPLTRYEESAVEQLAARMSMGENKTRLQISNFLKQLAMTSYENLGDLATMDDKMTTPEDYIHYLNQIKFHMTYTTSFSNEAIPFPLIDNWLEVGHCYSFNSIIAGYNRYEYWNNSFWNVSTEMKIYYGNVLDGDIFGQVEDINSGAKAYFHGHNDVPDAATPNVYMALGDYKTINLRAQSIYSTDETKLLTVKQRKCRFLHESDLSITPAYSYNACRMQCRADLSFKLCACVPHFYRYNPRGAKRSICGGQGLKCLEKHSELLIKLLDVKTGLKIKCNCMPSCDDVNFFMDGVEQIPWFLSTTVKWGVSVYPRMRLKRDILFGFYDLLVSIGGTAGLFLGCSVLSFIEIVYFFSIRLFWVSLRKLTAK